MYEPGLLKVTQIHEKNFTRRDFDSEEWSYQWVKYPGGLVLRLSHDRDPESTTVYDFVEFSTPVNIEFEYDEELAKIKET